MKEFKIKSFDGYELYCYLYDEVENPKGVYQITHGMAEHALRYKPFAEFLNKNGYIVFANDLRAHGKSAGSVEKVSLVVNGDLFDETVQDQIFLSKYLKEQYPNLPLFLMGHSYGSFITQRYIQLCDIPKAVILMGSARQDGMLCVAGSFINWFIYTFKGKDTPSKIIADISFGGYQKQFKEGHWITSVKEISDAYEADPYCGAIFSAGFYKYFFGNIRKTLYKKKNLQNIKKDLPLFIVSGELDPVGGPVKLVDLLYDTYIKLGLTNVSKKLYPNMRHEILNEVDYTTPYNDLLDFINKNND
ncbi:MAG: alpha/beta hydrolase [Clostridia bacterium]|nr:alpha/beta hydrolase [Clostridia bacterium]